MATNIVTQVITYQKSNLAYLQNLNAFIGTANTKFKNFQNEMGSLGNTVTFDLPPRFITTASLVATFQPAAQRIQTLTCDQQASVSYSFTAQQFLFNVHDYMTRFGKSATEELAAAIEVNVAGLCATSPYRFYGDGVTAINSYTQLASALAMFRNYGASAHGKAKGYLSDIVVPGIAGSGLQQFAIDRNNDLAMSWQLGEFSMCDWYQSNLLPIHISGSEGINNKTLTVVSTTQNADGGVTSITFSGTNAANDASSVLAFDRFQFNDGVAGQPNMRYLTFVGHQVSACPVQFLAAAGATSTAGSQVTVTCTPVLQAAVGANQNINNAIVVGMQVSVLPSHRVGMITAGDPLFLALPQLPEQTPFPTANHMDEDTGVSMRMYFGTLFGQNQQGIVHDAIWGSSLPGEYAMAMIFPL